MPGSDVQTRRGLRVEPSKIRGFYRRLSRVRTVLGSLINTSRNPLALKWARAKASPYMGVKNRAVGPPGEATLSAFDERAVWQQDCFWAPLQVGCQHPPPAAPLNCDLYIWSTASCVSDQTRGTVSASIAMQNAFLTVPRLMDSDRVPFSCSSRDDWIARGKLACKWRLRFPCHDGGAPRDGSGPRDIHCAWHPWRAPKSLSTSFYLFILLLSVHLSIRSSLFLISLNTTFMPSGWSWASRL